MKFSSQNADWPGEHRRKDGVPCAHMQPLATLLMVNPLFQLISKPARLRRASTTGGCKR